MRRSNLCARDDLYTLYPSEADGRNVFLIHTQPDELESHKRRTCPEVNSLRFVRLTKRPTFGLGLNLELVTTCARKGVKFHAVCSLFQAFR